MMLSICPRCSSPYLTTPDRDCCRCCADMAANIRRVLARREHSLFVLREPATKAYLASFSADGYTWVTRREQALRFHGLEEAEQGRERLEAAIARDWEKAGLTMPRVRLEIVYAGRVPTRTV